jgi:tripeptide aminopeptidase
MEDVLSRFLRYVQIDTQSRESDDGKQPTTEKQFDLARMLARELEDMGAEQVYLDETYCYVYARIPANLPEGRTAPTVGFIAHMDTSPAVSGANVKPRVLEYAGGDIDLSGDGTYVLRPADFPILDRFKGHELVVTDGSTLLGGDDKAGVAEIMTLAETLLTTPELKHGEVSIAFTPDEEVGMGVAHFDLDRFRADFGYTVDGGSLGGMEYENFNAASLRVKVRGRSTHTGAAKNAMVNAVLLAMEYASMLPPEERPEHTEGREGFYHLDSIQGDVEACRLDYIIRDHDLEKFRARKNRTLAIADYLNGKYGSGTFTVELRDSYFNMKEKVLPHMEIVDAALAAMKDLDIQPFISPIRGGTDGAMLSYRGLPCPNLCTGGQNCHSRYEFVSVPDMRKVVQLLARILEKHAG